MYLQLVHSPKIERFIDNSNSKDYQQSKLLFVYFGSKYFNIKYTTDDDYYYIQPVKELSKCQHCVSENYKNGSQYGNHCYEYEVLFKFKCHCNDFNEYQTLKIDKKNIIIYD